jgi:predicted Zn-dependent protease
MTRKHLLLAALLAIPAAAAAAQDDVCLRAMKNEMDRSMSSLKLGSFGKPYFLSYALRRDHDWKVRATLGAVIEETPSETAFAVPVLRVGGPGFDNTDYYGSVGNYPPYSYAPLDCDYDALRFALWQITDRAYTDAVEKLDQKRAFKEKRDIKERLDDFTPAPRAHILKDVAAQTPDYAALRAIAQKASLVFKDYPQLRDSEVFVAINSETRRYIDSEGAQYRLGDNTASVLVRAEVQLDDGFRTELNRSFYYDDFTKIPAADFFTAQAAEMAKQGVALVHSKMAEPYIGPVMFEDAAAGEFFRELLAHNLMRPRMWWTDGDRDQESGLLNDKLGMRVASPIVSVEDDPSLESYAGQPMFGGYEADDEGVPAQKLQLVKNGKLVNFPMSRAPTEKITASNGHGRGFFYYPQGFPSNLVVSVSSTVAQAELKGRLRAMCRALDLDYGIIIRSAGDLRGTFDAYKLYVSDGREEPVHGAQFAELGLRALRDIVLAGDKTGVYTNIYKETAFSIAAPSVIISEGELKKTDAKPEKPPYLDNPVTENK